MAMVASYRWTHSPGRLTWSEGWRPVGLQSSYESSMFYVMFMFMNSRKGLALMTVL